MGGAIMLKESKELIGSTFQFSVEIQDIRLNGTGSSYSNI
jgi:hypothetical protein